ncbi:hypothetical protein [Candidatus Pyrohabitans sp.]
MTSVKTGGVTIKNRDNTSETVRHAIRQLALKYGMRAGTLEEVRKIVGKAEAKSGETLSQSVKKIREEVI